MATAASAPTIEDFITCPVCQEIYDDPKVLICQHSLCKQCVKSMLEYAQKPSRTRKGQPRELTCPICRTVTKEDHIKSDLKTKGILDTTEAKSETESGYYGKTRLGESVKLCTLCLKKPVCKKCKECEHLLCQACSNCHLDIPACKNHHITNLDSIIKTTRKSLTTIKNQLSHGLVRTNKKQDSINFYETDNETAYKDLIKIADTWKEENIELINQHHQKIIDEILKIKQDELKDIFPLKEGVNEKEKEIQQGMAMLDTIINESNSARFLGQSERAIPKLEAIILSHDITIIPDKMEPSKLLNIKLQKGAKCDPTKSLTLQVQKRRRHNPFEYINIIKNRPNPSSDFPAELQLSPLEVSYSIKAENSLKQIVFHDGCLLCLYEDRLDVFDINGTWLRSMAKNISQANNFVNVSDEVIVACMKTGLMSFHVAGKFNTTLEDGVFCDVTTNNKNQIYALDYNNNKPTVTLYTKQRSKWNQTKIFELPYSKLNPCNSILWNGTFLLMTSIASDDTEGTLYRYHQSGLKLETYHRPGSLPRLCCADTKTGKVIITDSIKGNAYVFNPQDKSEKELFKLDTNSATGQGVNARNYSVTIDDEQGVWVCSYNHNILTRYVNTATEWLLV